MGRATRQPAWGTRVLTVVVVAAMATIGLEAGATVVGAAPPPDPDVAAITVGLGQFSDFAKGLANSGAFGNRLPYLTLQPGSPAGVDLATILTAAVTDRIVAQSPTHFGDLNNLGGTFDVGGRHVVSAVSTTPAPSGNTIERISLDLMVTKRADSGLALANASPLVDITAPSGVRVDLTLHEHFDFTFDTATSDFALSADPTTPAVTLDAEATIPATALSSIRPAIGLLEASVTASTFTESVHLRGKFADPDGDGVLAFSRSSSSGPVPGELATAANAAAIVDVGYAPTSASNISGALSLVSAASNVSGLTLPALAASVGVTDPNLADATPTAFTRTGFDATYDRFQNLDNRDLASGVRRIASLLDAMVSQRLTGNQGDLDLPFMKGRVSDVLGASELLRTFLAAHIDAEGNADFASIQQLFEKLDATAVGGATLDVADVAWDQNSSKLAFTLVGTRLTAAGATDVDAARGQAADTKTGAVRVADALRPSTGLAGANADAPDPTATAKRSYVLRLTVVLDLQPPKTGTACQGPSAAQLVDPVNVNNQACPFVRTDPKSQTNTVINELPRRADRILLRTNADLLRADADIDSPLPSGGLSALAGFVGVQLGGPGAKATLRTAAGQPNLVSIRLQALGDVRIGDASDRLASNPTSLMDYRTAGSGSINFTAAVPGAASFFAGSTGDTSVAMNDIATPATLAVTAPGAIARLKPLDFGGSADPAALRAKVLNALDGVSQTLTTLGPLASGGTTEPTLTQPIQVLGRPFAGYADVPALATSIGALTATPKNSLQEMLGALAPTVAASPPTFDLDTSSSPARLVLHVGVNRVGSAGAAPIGVAYDAGSGTRHLIGSSTSGMLAADVQTSGAFDVVVPLDASIAAGPDGVQVLPSSTLSIAPAVNVTGANLDVTAGVLALKLAGASVDAHPSLSLGGGSGPALSLHDWAKTSPTTTGGSNGGCGSVICATLPVRDAANAPQGTINVALGGSQLFTTVIGADAPPALSTAEATASLPLGNLLDGLVPYFKDLRNGLDRASFDGKLPFVGKDLQQGVAFLDDLQSRTSSALGTLTSSGGYAKVSDVTGAVNAAVGAVASGPVPVTGTQVTAKCGGVACDPNAPGSTIDDLAIGFDVGQGNPDPATGCGTGCVDAANRPFSIGIPGLRLSSGTSPKVSLGWKLHLGFGFSKALGFYIDTSAADELKVGLAVRLDITDAQPLSAELGFLKLNVSQRDAAAPIKPVFAGVFSIDVHAPGDALTLDQLASVADIGDIVSVRLKADVMADWRIKTDASSPIGGLFADLHVKWGLDTDPNSSGAINTLDIGFGQIGLNLPELFGGVLKPIFEKVQKVAKPLKPVVDAVQAPLPGLSDLSHLVGGGDISTLTLAELYTTYGDPSFGPLVKIIKLVSKVAAFAASGTITLNGFDLDAQKALAQLPSPDHLLELVKGQAFETLGAIKDKLQAACPECLDTLKEVSGEFGAILGVGAEDQGGFSFPIVDHPETVAGLLLGKDVDLARFDTGNTLDVGFHFDAEFGPIIPFPPLFVTVNLGGSLKARLRAGFDTKGIRDAVSSGNAAKLINGLYLGDFDDAGKDVDEISVLGNAYLGVAVSVVIASAGIEGGIDLTAYLNLHDTDTPEQPDVPHPGPPPGAGDGKVRFAEFGADANGDFDPACIFDTSGKIAASINVYVKVGIGPFSHKFSHNLGSATLVDLTHNCAAKADPILGEVLGDTLYVNVGRLNGARGSEWSNTALRAASGATDENVTVRALHAPAVGGAFTGFGIDLVQHHQDFLLADFPGLNRVVIDGRGSDVPLKVELAGDGAGISQADPTNAKRFDRPSVVFGSNGDDVIKAPTTSVVQADGRRGNDQIVTGDAGDQLAGGPGADSITGGFGDDRIEGDGYLAVDSTRTVAGVTDIANAVSAVAVPGEFLSAGLDQNGPDSIDAGLGRDDVYGQGGDDTINGGEQSALAATDSNPALRDPGNHIVGGSGADAIRGGGGDDRIFGDEDVTLAEDATGAPEGGDDHIDTGDGTDMVWAGAGADVVVGHSTTTAATHDTIYGNGGADRLNGGAGADFLYGGPDDDTALGFLGDDLVKGGTGNDHLGGDQELTPPAAGLRSFATPAGVAGDGADRVYGGPGNDDAYGGGGDDRIFGDDGLAACTGPSASAPEWTPVDEPLNANDGADVLVGGPGSDQMNGEGGADKLDGQGDADLLCGARDADVVSGGAAVDRIWGGSAIDSLYGDDGADRAYGNGEADLIFGGSGADHLEGNGGADSVYGEADDDRIIGGSTTAATPDEGDTILAGQQGRDVIIGDNGTATDDATAVVRIFDLSGSYDPTFGKSDLISGGSDADRGFGALGNDTMFGGSGDDHLEGNVGNDSISGEANQDDLIGGTSPEAFAGDATAAADVADSGETLISGGDERDVITGDNAVIVRPGGVDAITGGAARTVTLLDRDRTGAALTAVSGGDYIEGNAERDRAYGEGGNDYVKGNESDDYLEGNQNSDRLEGNDGEDDLIGGSSFASAPGVGDPDLGDQLAGGAGADVIAGDNAVITRDPAQPGGPYDWDTQSNSWIAPAARRSIIFLDKTTLSATRFGADVVSGGAGSDVGFGQDGNDQLFGGPADDYQEGNGGADILWGDKVAPPTGDVHESAAVLLDGPAGPDGQDDQIGGSSLVRATATSGAITGQRDAGDELHGDGNADVQLGDNGRILRRVSSGAYLTYLPQTGKPTIVRQAAFAASPATALPARFDVGAPASAGVWGNDVLYGDAGDDVQLAQDGDDLVLGGDGDDDQYGELGADRIFGEAGEDAMLGDRGVIVNKLSTPVAPFTSTGPPKFTFAPYAAHPLDRRVDMNDDGDGAPLQAPGLTTGGNDYLRGGLDHDAMHGETGDDLMNGDSGGDYLFGDDGVDVMWGGRGRICADPADAACNNDPGTKDTYVDYLFGGHSRVTDPVTGGADILDYRPRPGVDPQAWFDATNTNPSDPVTAHQHHQGIDWMYGGWDRDVMEANIADNGPNLGDRLIDWVGNYSLFVHCPAAYGGYNDIRQHSPDMQSYLQRLAFYLGAGKSVADVDTKGSSGYNDLALVYASDSKNNSGSAYPTTPGHFDSFSCAP